MKVRKIFILLFLSGIGMSSMAQNYADVKNDTLYFLDGRKKMAVNLLQGTANEKDFRFVSMGSNGSAPEPGVVEKADVYYHYSNGRYHLINERTTETEQGRLQKNLMLYNKQRNAGLSFVLLGVGALTGSLVAGEIQFAKQKKGEALESENLPKIMQYSGYGLMLVGTVVQINAGRYIKRATVDIRPTGVRLGIGIN
jgi:hypothetical protein